MAESNPLGEILGAILAAVEQARRIADEETLAIADYYRQNPLLAGMSIPRVRVPQLDVEIPVVIEEFEDRQVGEIADHETIPEKVARAVADAAANEDDRNPKGLAEEFVDVFALRLRSDFIHLRPRQPSAAADITARCASEVLTEIVKRPSRPRFNPDQFRRILRIVKAVALESAVARPSLPPQFRVTVLTSRVKDQADPSTITRIRLSVREDGVEWTSVERPDGTTRDHLVPE